MLNAQQYTTKYATVIRPPLGEQVGGKHQRNRTTPHRITTTPPYYVRQPHDFGGCSSHYSKTATMPRLTTWKGWHQCVDGYQLHKLLVQSTTTIAGLSLTATRAIFPSPFDCNNRSIQQSRYFNYPDGSISADEQFFTYLARTVQLSLLCWGLDVSQRDKKQHSVLQFIVISISLNFFIALAYCWRCLDQPPGVMAVGLVTEENNKSRNYKSTRYDTLPWIHVDYEFFYTFIFFYSYVHGLRGGNDIQSNGVVWLLRGKLLFCYRFKVITYTYEQKCWTISPRNENSDSWAQAGGTILCPSVPTF